MKLRGSLDYYGKWFFKNKKIKFNYINSGVLLLNLKKIRETKLLKRARQMCQNKKMFMPDESSLNKLSLSKKIEKSSRRELKKVFRRSFFMIPEYLFTYLPYLTETTIQSDSLNVPQMLLPVYQ